MNSIKSFIYLDEYKMYSISSQLFEGLTEYVLTGEKKSFSESEQQKGTFFSGKLMGDILIKEKDSSEKRFFHDYAFNLFEEELEKRKKLYSLKDIDVIDSLKGKSFIKVSGKAFFNDYTTLKETFLNFNNLGSALGYIQYYNTSGNVNETLIDKEKELKDRNQKNKIIVLKKELEKRFQEYLKDNSLLLDEGWLKHMADILSYGYKEQLEVRIPYYNNNIIFSSVLNRSYLKENDNSLVFKYSRKTEVDFTILGIITQVGDTRVSWNNQPNGNHFKLASQNVIDVLSNLEDTFTGRLDNECIIDPIAIYREL